MLMNFLPNLVIQFLEIEDFYIWLCRPVPPCPLVSGLIRVKGENIIIGGLNVTFKVI